MPGAEKMRGLRLIGVEARGAEGAEVVVVMTRGDVAGGTMCVGAASLMLMMMRELLGAENRLASPPELPRAVMSTCSRVKACGGLSSLFDEAIMRLAWLSLPASISESGAILAEPATSSETYPSQMQNSGS